MAFNLDDYVDVAERLRLFREKYPEGTIQPLSAERPFEIVTVGEQTFVVVVAAAYRTPEDPRPGVGMAWELFPGKTSYTRESELQNAETSAWGRAIVAVGAADTKYVASREEVQNRQESNGQQPDPAAHWRGIIRTKLADGTVTQDALTAATEKLKYPPSLEQTADQLKAVLREAEKACAKAKAEEAKVKS